MSRRTSTSLINFQQSLRAYESNSRPSISLSQKQDLEFNQIHSILKQITKTLEKGDYNQVSKSISKIMADEKFALKQHIARDVFVPSPLNSIGMKLLQQIEYWILLLISFELFAKKGEASETQYGKIISTMKQYIDFKMSLEAKKQAYNFCLKGGEDLNFLRSPRNFSICEENSNLAQCQSTALSSVQEENNQQLSQNRVQFLQDLQVINEINYANNQQTQTENATKHIDEVKDIAHDPAIKPFVRGRLWVQDLRNQNKQQELDELIDQDQEHHQKERAEINNQQEQSEKGRSVVQFYSLQKQRNQKRQSLSHVGLKLEKNNNQSQIVANQSQPRKSISKVKDNIKIIQNTRNSHRIKECQLHINQDKIGDNLELKNQNKPLSQKTKELENTKDLKKNQCTEKSYNLKHISSKLSIQSQKRQSKSQQAKEKNSNIVPQNETQ